MRCAALFAKPTAVPASASARNLIYVDGILISSPIGNNNTTASPHFGVAERPDITSIDVLYGPFAAEYSGNSIGAVVNITTAMPDRFELYGDALGAVQPFKYYGTDHTYGTWQLAGGAGDRYDDFAWRFSVNHLDSTGQPLGFVTVARPPSTSVSGTPVTGGFNDLNRAGAPIGVFGASSIEHQVQDTDTLKLEYDLPNQWQATYTVSFFHQQDDGSAETYIHNAAGTPIYTGSVNFGGYAYSLTPSSFSNGVYHWEQSHLAQAASLRSAPDGAFSWEIVATDFAYLTDNQRAPGTALPSATSGGAGTITRLNGTGWYTLDAKGIWRGWDDHEVSLAPTGMQRRSTRPSTTRRTGSGAHPRRSPASAEVARQPMRSGYRTSGPSRHSLRRPWACGMRTGRRITGSISRPRRHSIQSNQGFRGTISRPKRRSPGHLLIRGA